MSFEQILSAVLAILALTNAELAGRKRRSAWVVGMVAQAGWVGFMLLTGNFGFLISITGFTVVYIRNYRAWSRSSGDAPGKREPVTGDPGNQVDVKMEDLLAGNRAPAGDDVAVPDPRRQLCGASHRHAGD
jgi:hypothetical protein